MLDRVSRASVDTAWIYVRRWLLLALGAASLMWPLAAAGLTATPSATVTPTLPYGTPTLPPTPLATGDLGTKHVVGRVTEANTEPPRGIADATVSYGSGSVPANEDGEFSFDIFLHDTNSVTIRASAPGFKTAQLRFTGVELWFTYEPIAIALERDGSRVSVSVDRGPYCGPQTQITLVLTDSTGGERAITLTGGGGVAFEQVPDGEYVLSALSDCPLAEYAPRQVSVAGANVGVAFVPDPCPSTLLLVPPSGPPGTEVTVSGRCYYIHSGQLARINFDDVRQLDTIGETGGDYTATFRVPDDAVLGAHAVTVTNQAGTVIGAGDFTVVDPSAPCLGDCNADGQVRIDELLTMVNMAFGDLAADTCPAALAGDRETIQIDALVGAVNAALDGCAPSPPPPTVEPTPPSSGYCYEAVECPWSDGPYQPIDASREYCCTLWTSLRLPFSWCSADAFDPVTKECGECVAPCE
jgi:hypothetical protein